ncbi:MAG: HEAT repeat domain-containing protein [Caldilineaceae bacterium]
MNRRESGVDAPRGRPEDTQLLFPQFVKAVAAGDDDDAEALCQQLTAADEPKLIGLIADADLDMRWWALRALAQCGTAQSVAAIAVVLAAPQPELRQVATLTLGHIFQSAPERVSRQLPTLATLLRDEDGMVRQAAMMALSMCGDDAVAVLAEILAGSHQGARTRAAQALRRIGSMGAAAVLYRHLEDPNHLVRTHAYEALDEMGLLENILVTL